MKKPKFNLKEIEWKQFFLQKGEKIALGVSAGIMSLLLLFSVISAVSSKSPASNADEVAKLNTSAKQTMARQPDDGDKKKYGELEPDLKEAEAPKPVNPHEFTTNIPFFLSSPVEDRKWRQPEILAAEEFGYKYVRGAVQSNMVSPPDEEGKITVWVLENVQRVNDVEKSSKEAAKKLGLRIRDRKNMMNPLMRGPGGGGPPAGKGGMGGMGGPGFGGPGGMGGPGFGGGVASGGKDEVRIRPMSLDDFENQGGTIAQTVRPVRMVQVVGTFPLRAQYERWKQALRVTSVSDIPEDAKPEFAGMEIQRRQFGSDGKLSDWSALPQDDLKRIWIEMVAREPEDQELDSYGMIVHPNRLVQPRPMLAREQKYPDVKLEGLDQSLAAMKKVREPEKPKEENKKSRFKEFGDWEENPADMGGRGPGMNNPGMNPGSGGAPGLGNRPGLPNGGGASGPGREPSEMMSPGVGIGPKGGKNRRPAGGAAGPGTPGTADSNLPPEQLIPEKVMVRFLDVNVQPGNTYQYRIKIRITNPLWHRDDKAVQKDITDAKELASDWAMVAAKKDAAEPLSVHIPDDIELYAADEPIDNRQASASQERTAVQIHRWLDRQRLNPTDKDSEQPLGDWTIDQRLLVERGQYLGKWKEIELPVWSPTKERFQLALHPEDRNARGRPNRHQGIPVDFNTWSVLVDFQGGKRELSVGDRRVTDEGPLEVLVLTPDGRLVVHDGRADSDNKERKERVEAWKKEVEEVKKNTDSSGGGRMDDMFGPKKKGSGGGAGGGPGPG